MQQIVISKSEGGKNEYLDDFVCGSTHSLAGRLYDLSRSGRTDSPPSRVRCDLSNLAFCSRYADGMSGGRVKKTPLRTASTISTPVLSSINSETLRPAEGSFGTRFSALRHIPKHVQKMVAGYKSRGQKRFARSDTASVVITGGGSCGVAAVDLSQRKF